MLTEHHTLLSLVDQPININIYTNCSQGRSRYNKSVSMVQKWAIGAMINISGSIAINLGTNLMKLSHKVTTRNASCVGW